MPPTGFTRPALLLLVACLGLSHIAAAAGDADKARRELGSITRKLNDLDTWFSDAQSRQRKLQKEIKAADQKIAATGTEVHHIRDELADTQAELVRLREARDELEERRTEQAGHIAEHLTSAYRLSGQDFFKLLLNQENPEELDRMVRYHRYFSQARTETLKEYQRTLAGLEANQTETRAREHSLAQQQDELDAGLEELRQNRSERETLLAKLEGEMTGKGKERDRLAADRTRLEKLIAELARRAETLDAGTFVQNKGKLHWPLTGKLANSFGAPRSGGKLTWQGIFISAAEGIPVTAIHRGRVAFSDWLRGFGLVTIVDHGGGYMSLYAHADTLYKRAGDWVESGEAIATAGKSGGQSRPGLYFEIRAKGQPNDPIVWLAKR